MTAADAFEAYATFRGLSMVADKYQAIASSAQTATLARSRMKADPDADGPHTTIKRDPPSGKITNYQEWNSPSDPRDPKKFEPGKRVDVAGGSHYNKTTGTVVQTPHVQEKGIPGGVRPETPQEIPRQ